jgi:tetratricopeptide (TPR) repeat protein
MRRRGFLLLAGLAPAAAAQLKERDAAAADATRGMVDEDEDVLQKTDYAFNPIQAAHELKVGDFYRKKGSRRAAASRYLEATRWNPRLGEAYWKLAEVREELEQPAEALEAYRKYLRVDPDGKWAKQSRKRAEQLAARVEDSEAESGREP